MNISLKAYQPLPVLISGQWVHLETAQQAVALESENGDRVTLRKNAVVKSQSVIGRVLIHSDIDQEITLEFGYGDYTPPQNIQGQTVLVSELPAVKIAPEQNIAVSSLPAVKIAPEQAVKVSELPAVQIEANQSVAVSQIPPVELAPEQSVKVTSLPVVRIAANQAVKVTESDQLVVLESVMPLSIPANSERKRLYIKAKTTNAQDVLINGVYPLNPGEKIELATRAAVELTGAASESVVVLEI
ncbi:hypothetical protein LZU85_14095 [Vibrio sp. IRLE0018]|uniref:hypothetical protein n=1 Tax=Vibrio floridensis TaxID=2908007 RepID=UPI001F383292|nr:hypothetical protein [Vibrio floridensis]MCF8779933.1 hypothetical protein [Vibrio floridensis]